MANHGNSRSGARPGQTPSAPQASHPQAPAATPAAHQAQKPAAPEPADPDVYHVVGPGSIWFEQKLHGPGSIVTLSRKQADGYGELIAHGPPRKPRSVDYSKRKAGLYTVCGAGKLRHNKRTYRSGDLVELTAEEARSLGAAIEPE